MLSRQRHCVQWHNKKTTNPMILTAIIILIGVYVFFEMINNKEL